MEPTSLQPGQKYIFKFQTAREVTPLISFIGIRLKMVVMPQIFLHQDLPTQTVRTILAYVR
jgi:hypothetical protein